MQTLFLKRQKIRVCMTGRLLCFRSDSTVERLKKGVAVIPQGRAGFYTPECTIRL